MLRKIKIFGMAVAFLCATSIAGQVSAAAPESKDPVKIAINDWTSQYIQSYIVGGMLDRMGYNVEYVQADPMAQFPGFESGDLHMQVEIWPTSQSELVAASVATGTVIKMGELGMAAKESWWYPTYMEETCPGLPKWEALRDCAELFAAPETAPMGRYLGGPVTWAGNDEERAEAFGLEFEVIHAGTEAAIWAELASAYQRKAAFIGWLWVPHWWPVKYDGKFIDFPTYEAACYTDASWGVNPDKTHDCAKPAGVLSKLAWAGGDEKFPMAWQAFRNYVMDVKTLGSLIAAVDLDGGDPQEVAEKWLNENEAIWTPWTK